MNPDKITIGIELECLLSENVFPTDQLYYQNLREVAPYWFGGTDGSIRKYTQIFSYPDFGKMPTDILKAGEVKRKIDEWYKQTYGGIHVEYKPIELTTGEKTEYDTIEPISLSQVDLAIDHLRIYLGVTEEELWHHKIQINHSCGGHLHMSFEDRPLPITVGILNKAKVDYKQWLLKNRGEEALETFKNFYYRSSYVPKMKAGEITTERREFCANLGVEWRGFHYMKTENIKDFRERTKAGLEAFANAFELSLTSKKVFYHKPFPGLKVSGIIEKVIKIPQPFPQEFPCAI